MVTELEKGLIIEFLGTFGRLSVKGSQREEQDRLDFGGEVGYQV